MARMQCKMCGGMVEIPPGVTSGECPYCGALTTFPKAKDSQAEQLYNRAEHFRALCDFDKAVGIYEELINAGGDDAEYYWGLVISRFGIEYVEDPVSHERIPTCHRVQYESILTDPDYQQALELADGSSRMVYEEQAKRIAEIQKGILAISSQEKPYDVFICYKETTDGGSRTKDSTLAQDIYYQLTNEGLKVFFARITLEDKLGQQYEPYIFAALNSAKVMLVIGSKKEYFNAVWVKNEWSRYLALMRKDHSKLLIPCYKDMDAYDIPDELSMLQSQDMSKIGFLQDILRGIKKVVGKSNSGNSEENTGKTQFSESASLLKRAKMFLGDNDWNSAKEYANRILDKEPENGAAFLVLFLAEHKLASLDVIQFSPDESLKDKNFIRAQKYADAQLKSDIQKALQERADYRRKQQEDDDFNNLATQAAELLMNKEERYADRLKKLEECLAHADKLIRHEGGEELKNKLADEIKRMKEDAQKRLDEAIVLYNESQDAKDFEKVLDLFNDLEKDGINDGNEYLKACVENIRTLTYNEQVEEFSRCTTSMEFLALADNLSKISELQQAGELEQRCRKAAADARIKEKYDLILEKMQHFHYFEANALLKQLPADVVVPPSIMARCRRGVRMLWTMIVIAIGLIVFAGVYGNVLAMIVLAIGLLLFAGVKGCMVVEEKRIAYQKLLAMKKRFNEKLKKNYADVLHLIRIPAGDFQMGSNNGDDDETVHKVTISKPFWIGKYEVTQAEWKAVMRNDPSYFRGDNRPVENVSWEDAIAFCKKLNEKCASSLPAGYHFDLPTEAQWEYACRAGSTGDYSGGTIDQVAWYNGNSGDKTHEVGQKSPNAWGLYDMHGNVWEWCKDWYGKYPSGHVTDPAGPASGSGRVGRGGSWLSGASDCRAAYRNNFAPSIRDDYLGFRLALVPVQ